MMNIFEKSIVLIRTFCFCASVIAMISFLFLFSVCAVGQIQQIVNSKKTSDAPKTWIDAEAQHKVVRISDEPGSKSLYFNQNVYTPDGKRMVYWAPHGLYVVDLENFASRQLIAGRTHHSFVMGTTTPTVYFMKSGDQHVYSINIDTGYILQLSELPGHATTISSVNADETLIGGTYLEEADSSWHDLKLKELEKFPSAQTRSLKTSGKLHLQLKYLASLKRQTSGTAEVIFTYNLQTGKINTVLRSNDWLNHVLFSPIDTALLMYCHEGRSSELQRVWTIRADGMQNKLIHKTASGEYATHEFWSKDGKTIWYETGKEKDASGVKKPSLMGSSLENGKQRQYQVGQDQISFHYLSSTKEDMFVGDGTVHPASSRWISIMHPQLNSVAPSSSGSVVSENFSTEHLVNLAKNNYLKLEPNARFSPDEKWVIFTSNMFGKSYVFAVEVAQVQK